MSGENLLINADFEGGWTRKTCRGEFGNIYVPEGWELCWKEGLPVEHDPSNPNGYGQPEMKLIGRVPPFLDPIRILNGNQAIEVFTFYRIHDIVLMQVVGGFQPGDKARGDFWTHAWSSRFDDSKKSDNIKPGDFANFTFSVGIDPTGGKNPWADTVVWGEGAHIYDKYAPVPAVEAIAEAEQVTFFIRSAVLWPFKHCNAYFDKPNLVKVVAPPPVECLGTPREQYDAVRWLLPSGSSEEERYDAIDLVAQSGGTLCYSFDDACQGNLKSRLVKYLWYHKDSWDKAAYEAEMLKAYPGVMWEHIIRYDDSTPPPPPPGAPPNIIHYTRNMIGTHDQRTKPLWDVYLREAKPNLIKVFTLDHAIQARLNNPDALVIWRKYQSREEQHELMNGDLKEGALKLADKYAAEITEYSITHGMTEDQIFELMQPWAIESVNEEVSTFNPPQLQKAQTFDIWFSHWVHKKWGKKINAGIMTIPVGNPHETEFKDLIPVAKVCHDTGDFFSYHNYWTTNRSKTFLVDRWVNFAGRQFEMDKVFNAAGYYPRYYGGESGCLYSYDGWQLNAHNAWKSCGNFTYYMDQIELLNQRILEWNQNNQGRYFGACLFTYGNFGWDDFTWNEGDMRELIERMKPYGRME